MLRWMVSSFAQDGSSHHHVVEELGDPHDYARQREQKGESVRLSVWDPARHPFEVQWESAE